MRRKFCAFSLSHPARGAWIEIYSYFTAFSSCFQSHPARGAWIEITLLQIVDQLTERRTPQGVRGLKYQSKYKNVLENPSHPARGAWIEI